MMRSLWTAASGMMAQQTNMDVVSHNLSNVNTTGYKKQSTEFNDLIYVTLRSGFRQVEGSVQGTVPTNLQIGHGVTPVATKRLFIVGNMEESGNKTDFALTGDGFFQIQMPDGTIQYTRDGSFNINPDDDTTLYTNDGYPVVGELTTEDNGDLTMTFECARFTNEPGLESVGDNRFIETTASGTPITGAPGEEGIGNVRQFYLEMSNVEVAEEMVKMIIAQRAYESNTKAIQASDEMLGMANALRG